MREYKWESIKNISGAKGKFKRALLQFTPESWTHVRWLDPNSSYMRLVAIIQLMLIWQACIMYYYLCWGDLMVERVCTTQWINYSKWFVLTINIYFITFPFSLGVLNFCFSCDFFNIFIFLGCGTEHILYKTYFPYACRASHMCDKNTYDRVDCSPNN